MIGMTVCSGIGAPELSAPWIDWRYQSEIEPFPSAVLAHRFPSAVNLGDMTRFQEWPDATVDVLCGGTPCQSFSVAGLRKGLDDPRGNLMLTYLAIARRYRPRWLVWENVPGVLSSNGGRDFGSFLGGLGDLGYGFAYRVLDAQYTRTRDFPRAVPQRRRRVFVVGYLGDWRRAAAVFFDADSLSGNPPPRRETGQGAARGAAAGAAISSGQGWWAESDIAATIRAQDSVTKADTLIPQAFGGGNTSGPLDAAACLTARGQRIDFEVETFIAAPTTANALRAEGHDAGEDGTGQQTLIAFNAQQDPEVTFDRAGPLGVTSTQAQAVAFSCKDYGADAQTEVAPTMRAMGHDGSHANAGGQVAVAWALGSHAGTADGDQTNRSHASGGPVGSGISEGVSHSLRSGRTQSIATPYAVRRLTPTECERLMGFPDGWTDIPYRGKPAADGPRYKALGNSWAVNCGQWIFDRIRMVEELP